MGKFSYSMAGYSLKGRCACSTPQAERIATKQKAKVTRKRMIGTGLIEEQRSQNNMPGK